MKQMEEPLAAAEPRVGRRRLLVAVVAVIVLLLAIFLPPLVNLGHYRRVIATSVGGALGRPVAIGSMQLRLLPMPGITMSDFTVAEDPAFGYEPVLHANSVVASLRLSSLWRGRLEVSSISLDEVSLNLVGNDAGQWNIGSVLTRAAQSPGEATGNARSRPWPRFPYIEASDARIDFKNGAEKRPFSLMNAQFAMWQAGADEWRIRLKAQPVRTDLQLNLSDAGVMTLTGSLRRSSDVHTMPLDLHADWTGAQLGQATSLLTGVDAGWRGDLSIVASATGTANDLSLTSQVRIADLRRQEFQPVSSIDISGNCRGRYLRDQGFQDIACFAPAGRGHLLLTGSTQGFVSPKLDLSLEVNQVPVSLPLSFLGLVRLTLGNLSATGTIDGDFHLVTRAAPSFSGDATAKDIKLQYPGGNIVLPTLHFTAPRGQAPTVPKHKKPARPAPVPAIPELVMNPFVIPLGEPQPLSIDGHFSRAGFLIHLNGPASISRIIGAGHALGMPKSWFSAATGKGRADLTASLQGSWLAPVTGSTAGITSSGNVRVSGIELRSQFLRSPLEVLSADINLSPDQIAWQNAAIRYNGLSLHGSVAFPTNCSQPTPCPASFSLDAPDATGTSLISALHRTSSGFFGGMLSGLSSGIPPAWPPMQGTLHFGTLTLDRLALRNLNARMTTEGAGIAIQSLDAAALGGTVHATGDMAVSNGGLHWNLDVRFTGVDAGDAGAIFQERWGSGAASGNVQLKMSGYRTADLASSAKGDFTFTWQNGGLSNPDLPPPLLHFTRWTGAGTVDQNTITLNSGGITAARAGTSSPASNSVQGTIGFNRDLNLTVRTKQALLTITGTLSNPTAGPWSVSP